MSILERGIVLLKLSYVVRRLANAVPMTRRARSKAPKQCTLIAKRVVGRLGYVRTQVTLYAMHRPRWRPFRA